MYYNLFLFSVTRKSGREKRASMESNEQGGRTRWLRIELVLRHNQDQLSTRGKIRQGNEKEKKRVEISMKKRDKCRCNLHRCRTDVRTYERTKVGLSYDSVCSRGPALDPAKRIFFLFFISSRLRPRRRNRRPCITFGSLRSGLLFGIVARPHRHHGPSRSHLNHRPGWNRRFHPPQQV